MVCRSLTKHRNAHQVNLTVIIKHPDSINHKRQNSIEKKVLTLQGLSGWTITIFIRILSKNPTLKLKCLHQF